MAGERRIVIGDLLDGKYEITGILGEGAMGVVYEAIHTRLGRTVALKTVLDDIADNAELVSRFEREARAASAIGHPNIVQVFDAGDEPIPYLVMERLEGQSLEERLAASGPMEPDQAATMVRECLAGLAAAHRGGIVHRDLKPGNLFIATSETDGAESMKILDFGISKILDANDTGDGRATRAGMVMGTPLYMSPEQTRGQLDIDHRADLWSMACVLYECLAGKPPFDGENHNQIMAAVLAGTFSSLKERRPGVTDALSGFLDRALDADINKRFSDAESMSAALEEAVRASGSSSTDASAFDNLADRFLAQEAEERASVAAPAVAPTVQVPTPAPITSSEDQFAPPELNEPLGLALDVEKPATVPTRDVPSASSKAPETRRSRAKSQWVTREAPPSAGAKFFKVVLLLVLLAGGYAGYRYHTLGYLLSPPPPPPATFTVSVQPIEASFLVNDVKQDSKTVTFEGDTQLKVAFRADGHIAMAGNVSATAGERRSIAVRLPHAMRKLQIVVPAEPAEAIADARNLSAAEIATGYAKLDALVDCGVRLSQSLHAALAGSESEPVPYNLVDECRLVVEVNAPKAPSLDPLDGASKELVDRIEALNQSLRELKTSAGAASKLRRKLKSDAQAAAERARLSRRDWLDAMNLAESRWVQEEAARAKAAEGESFYAEMRVLMTASDSWVRAQLAGGTSAKSFRESLSELHALATRRAEREPELFKSSGALQLLRAMAPLASEIEIEDPLAHHNKAIELFNQLLLPMP